jgi:1-deoxy-D-xylulose-5-phosphate reductoisomerase
VEAFLAGRLPFTGIARVISDTLDTVAAGEAKSLEAVMAADTESRRVAGTRVARLAPALSS